MSNYNERERFFSQYDKCSVFESCRIYLSTISKKFSIIGLKSHLLRMQKSSQVYQLRIFDIAEVIENISKFLNKNSPLFSSIKNYYLRIVNSKNGIEFFIVEFTLNKDSYVNVCTFTGVRNNPEIKSTNIEISNNARNFANLNNCYEALLIDQNGYLREGAWSNFFWIDRDSNWQTPRSKILAGITRSQILEYLHFKNTKCREEDVLLPQILNKIDSGFICNSLQGIVAISQIDDLKLPNSFDIISFKENFKNYQNMHRVTLC